MGRFRTLANAPLERLQEIDSLTSIGVVGDLDGLAAVDLALDQLEHRVLIAIGKGSGVKLGGLVFNQFFCQSQLVRVRGALANVLKNRSGGSHFSRIAQRD